MAHSQLISDCRKTFKFYGKFRQILTLKIIIIMATKNTKSAKDLTPDQKKIKSLEKKLKRSEESANWLREQCYKYRDLLVKERQEFAETQVYIGPYVKDLESMKAFHQGEADKWRKMYTDMLPIYEEVIKLRNEKFLHNFKDKGIGPSWDEVKRLALDSISRCDQEDAENQKSKHSGEVVPLASFRCMESNRLESSEGNSFPADLVHTRVLKHLNN